VCATFWKWLAQTWRRLGKHVFSRGIVAAISQHRHPADALFSADVPRCIHRRSIVGTNLSSTETPDVNSENLLVLLAPLVFIYGVSLLFTLVDQMDLARDSTALRRHGHFCRHLLSADDFCIVAHPQFSAGISAVLSAGNPADLGAI